MVDEHSLLCYRTTDFLIYFRYILGCFRNFHRLCYNSVSLIAACLRIYRTDKVDEIVKTQIRVKTDGIPADKELSVGFENPSYHAGGGEVVIHPIEETNDLIVETQLNELNGQKEIKYQIRII